MLGTATNTVSSQESISLRMPSRTKRRQRVSQRWPNEPVTKSMACPTTWFGILTRMKNLAMHSVDPMQNISILLGSGSIPIYLYRPVDSEQLLYDRVGDRRRKHCTKSMNTDGWTDATYPLSMMAGRVLTPNGVPGGSGILNSSCSYHEQSYIRHTSDISTYTPAVDVLG